MALPHLPPAKRLKWFQTTQLRYCIDSAFRSAYRRRHHQTAQNAAAAGAKKKQLAPTRRWLLHILQECDLKPINWANVRCMALLHSFRRSSAEVCAKCWTILPSDQGSERSRVSHAHIEVYPLCPELVPRAVRDLRGSYFSTCPYACNATVALSRGPLSVAGLRPDLG